MLRKRVIPIVLLDGFSVLKTIQFKQRRNLGSPVTVVRTYNTRNVDELILLDIDASKQGRAIDKFTIQDLARECFMPLTVGGGISTLGDIEDLLKKGADKVAINSVALSRPSFINEAAKVFGSQCIVHSIDVVEDGSDFAVFSNGQVCTESNFFDLIKQSEDLGAGELLINNVTRDGCMQGGNRYLAELVSSTVRIPVIYAGGISSASDVATVASTSVSGVGVSSLFHFTDTTPDLCRKAMAAANIPVR
ncbi:cyclase [Oceanospirillum multiglobuliferum]|uniref:Imidazole glycerol phosphate synthase cyclase subunit n=1 Tax=Oceanospirillum multiglobuliferum TaxID=64969 RepID=A0A1T4L3D4_9GAMM|nr:HisA/HisF-related TIM barrel protein [Oceanospirillum multiglobuliferum]OPX56817.1 imidazole glycerol phosphate synthase cyclase subunit [Oceanospirillum multiglobuliferum]SJZ49229.1 cyclase [Oceanospirillum multiglobuliferum]